MTDQLATVLAVGLPAIAALVLLAGWIAYRGMAFYPVRDPADIEASCLEAGTVTRERLALPWQRTRIASPFGYQLAVYALKGRTDRVAVFHHGISLNWLGMFRYMGSFIEDGWTVVALDSRGHGATTRGIAGDPRSGGRDARPSYGFYEKRDLKAAVDWALANFPHGGGLVAVGESMGAATVLQYAPTDDRLDAAVADCSFSSAAAELDHRLRRSMVPPGLRGLAVRAADRLFRSREGFSLFEASPERAIMETMVPILFVHGLADDYVPWRMSVAMAEARRRRLPGALTELRLVSNARHAKSYDADPKAYARALREFLAAALGGPATRPPRRSPGASSRP